MEALVRVSPPPAAVPCQAMVGRESASADGTAGNGRQACGDRIRARVRKAGVTRDARYSISARRCHPHYEQIA